MVPSRKLIINADDFGISPEVNKGILTAFERGVITDSTLLIKAQYSHEAVAMVRSTPGFNVGIHINVDPLLGWESPGKEKFPRQEVLAMMKESSFQKKIKNEIYDQIETFLDTGLVPSHIDTHHHVHGFPEIFKLIMVAMDKFEINAMRYGRKGYFLLGREDILISKDTAMRMEEMLSHRGIFYPNHLIDSSIPFSLKELPTGVTELVVHPSIAGDEWRQKDFDMIVDPGFLINLREEDIHLTSYHEMVALKKSPGAS